MMALHISMDGLSITNQDAAEAIMAVIYAEAKRRADTITLPRADYAEIPAHIAADAMQRGRT